MPAYIPNIYNDEEFKEEILYLRRYFQDLEKNGKLTDGLKYIKEIRVEWLFEVVFNKKFFKGEQSRVAYIRDIEDNYQDGINFLSSLEGKRFIDVLHYFANIYKITDEQKGGRNV